MSRSNTTISILAALFAGLAWLPKSAAQSPPHIAEIDRVRLREAVRLADQFGDTVWPNWSGAPFAIILVTAEGEFLIRQPNPSPDFTLVAGDTLLGGSVFYRKRVFNTAMQATFPAVNGVNTIVIGRAELTSDKASTRWVLTVLHEHFHQLVYSRPGYYDEVAKLDLAHGDNTGMWMLNFPFPYDSVRVQEKFSAMTHALLDALGQGDGAEFNQKVAAFRRARNEFRNALPAEAERYFEFQLWQEGVARYTELRIGDMASTHYTASAEYTALADYSSPSSVSDAMRGRIMGDLGSLSLAKSRREVVYSVGAAEALLLDRVKPKWKEDYFRRPFRLPEP